MERRLDQVLSGGEQPRDAVDGTLAAARPAAK